MYHSLESCFKDEPGTELLPLLTQAERLLRGRQALLRRGDLIGERPDPGPCLDDLPGHAFRFGTR